MKGKNLFLIGNLFLVAFVLWTVLVRIVDVGAIGPNGSAVGFATFNKFVHSFIGVHITLYTITDWLGLVPFAVILGFAILGFAQWIKRKSILNVDYNILVLGGFYIIVMAIYVLFEMVAINCRPILINGCPEVSYPSSTTMLSMCVMPTATVQFNARIKNIKLKKCVCFFCNAFTVFMVVGRLISGVHWVTDIIGGMLVSAGLVIMYRFVCSLKINRYML